ncbi:MAG: hypothetical protein HY929_06920 [Euryarchaeota archaeon]|nr:hypothetical protein [Euryarchaeota archaeon]
MKRILSGLLIVLLVFVTIPTATATSAHDVAVTTISPSKTAITQSESVNISVKVKNNGTANETFNLVLKDNTQNITIGNQSVSLVAGADTTVVFSWTTSLATSVGNHTITAIAGPVANETDPTDNSKSTTVAVIAIVHDVAVTSIAAPSSCAQGELVSVNVNIKNKGTIGEIFKVILTDTTDGKNIGNQSIALAANANTTVSFNWNTTLASLGTHVLAATAGPVSGETSTGDNIKTKTILVGSLIHDVAITSVALSKTSAAVGDKISISVIAKNNGTVTETFNVSCYYNTTLIGKQKVTSLVAGASKNLTFTWNTTGVALGAHIISANASAVSGETNTANNRYVDGTVVISAQPAVQFAVTVDANGPYVPGSEVEIKGKATNGTAPVANASVEVTVKNPAGAVIFSATGNDSLKTGSNGKYEAEFRLAENATLGTYAVLIKAVKGNLNGTASTTFEVVQAIEGQAKLELNITTTKTEVNAGESVGLVIALKNLGNVTARNVNIRVHVKAGWKFMLIEVNPASAIPQHGRYQRAFEIKEIQPGETVTMKFNVLVKRQKKTKIYPLAVRVSYKPALEMPREKITKIVNILVHGQSKSKPNFERTEKAEKGSKGKHRGRED